MASNVTYRASPSLAMEIILGARFRFCVLTLKSPKPLSGLLLAVSGAPPSRKPTWHMAVRQRQPAWPTWRGSGCARRCGDAVTVRI
eukprot:scaffold1847_cov131-Isochrysis_galbana.AAC.6